MNWGNKLVLAFVAFVALMATLVYKSMNTKFELVSKDYYKDELKYQDKIDATSAAAKLGEVSITTIADSVQISLPKELENSIINGSVWFYCNTDEKKDRHIDFARVTNNKFLIPTSQLSKANYQAKISYAVNNNHYYSEKQITIQ
jgi:hypothetical protein